MAKEDDHASCSSTDESQDSVAKQLLELDRKSDERRRKRTKNGREARAEAPPLEDPPEFHSIDHDSSSKSPTVVTKKTDTLFDWDLPSSSDSSLSDEDEDFGQHKNKRKDGMKEGNYHSGSPVKRPQASKYFGQSKTTMLTVKRNSNRDDEDDSSFASSFSDGDEEGDDLFFGTTNNKNKSHRSSIKAVMEPSAHAKDTTKVDRDVSSIKDRVERPKLLAQTKASSSTVITNPYKNSTTRRTTKKNQGGPTPKTADKNNQNHLANSNPVSLDDSLKQTVSQQQTSSIPEITMDDNARRGMKPACAIADNAASVLSATPLDEENEADEIIDLDQMILEELAEVEKELGEDTTTTKKASSSEVGGGIQQDQEPTFDYLFGVDESGINTADSSPWETSESPYEEFIDTDSRPSEIHPDLLVPVPADTSRRPLVHRFTAANNPVVQRRRLHAKQVFDLYSSSILKFFKFTEFNHFQSEVASALADSDDNLVVSAPTGAGKTTVFEMAMARFFTADIRVNNGKTTNQRKVMYIAPSKALCEERLEDWSTRLAPLNLHVAAITGDGEPGEAFRDVAAANLIVTTPEKWDSMTRKWTENFYLFASVKLVLIDEVHLLADPTRGACLEAVILRMKTLDRAAQNVETNESIIAASSYTQTSPEAVRSPVRMVGVSATLPNTDEIAQFLGAHEAYSFDDSYRPVPLRTHVCGMGWIGGSGAKNNQFHFWRKLDEEVPHIVHKFSKGKPSIVFCHSKADTEKLAERFSSTGISRNKNKHDIASQTRLHKLQRTLLAGVAYHHAGMDVEDRRTVERLFMTRQITVLCATSTLAMGINLPAHCVVIKGTKAWRGGSEGYADIDQASLLQMIGRAGRPGHDTSGVAVIMTDNKSKPQFEALASSGLDPAKSQLLSKIDDFANAEIAQGVIRDADSFSAWLTNSLFYLQHTRGTSFCEDNAISSKADDQINDMVYHSIRRLQSCALINVDDNSGQIFPLEASSIMSNHLVDIDAMRIIVDVASDATQVQLLRAICDVEGLHRPVRRAEKRVLNELHKSIKYKLDGPPSKVRVQHPWQKTFVLLQAGIDNLPLEGEYALTQEMRSMGDFASRICAFVEQYAARASGSGNLAAQALKLRRAIHTKMWSTENGVLNQFSTLSKETVTKLRFNGITSFDDVMSVSEERIESVTSSRPPFGRNLKAAIRKTLARKLSLSATLESSENGGTALQLRLVENDVNSITQNSVPSAEKDAAVEFTLIAYTEKECLIYKKVDDALELKVPMPKEYAGVTSILISSIVGLDARVTLGGNKSAPKNQSHPTKVREIPGRQNASSKKKRQQTELGFQPKKKAEGARSEAVSVSKKPRTKHINKRHSTAPNTSKTAVTPSPQPPEPRFTFSRQNMPDQNEHGSQHVVNNRVGRIPPPISKDFSQNPLVMQGPRRDGYQSHLATSPKSSIRMQQTQHGTRIQAASSGWNQTHRHETDQLRIKSTKSLQKRAFVSPKQNPFNAFKHDPNQALGVLESSAASIIPKKSQMELENAYSQYRSQKKSPPFSQQQHGLMKRRSYAPSLARRDLHPTEVLSQKAHESNMNAAQGHMHRFPRRWDQYPGDFATQTRFQEAQQMQMPEQEYGQGQGYRQGGDYVFEQQDFQEYPEQFMVQGGCEPDYRVYQQPQHYQEYLSAGEEGRGQSYQQLDGNTFGFAFEEDDFPFGA